ncbi:MULTISPECIES: hypothetical protein [Burkholderiaceae]|uniref:hypothetical protein n=1 Tax=Burkholderiaceae TaxID=119060 RepID=UPI000963B4DF|nr:MULTISPECIES: hypothetical protein [Burkholderiaceae]MCG1019538.1 hypothetical protein [Mycetohabitans sp. B4]SIT71744.1 hypothetical protein SAMN04487768_2329 [Burkholderia sp. b13]
MDFDLHAALNDYQAYMYALESCPQPAASAPPPILKPASGGLASPSASRPTTYHDLPRELIEQIGDYVPVQDVGNFSAADRRTYHAMQSRRVVYRYWQRANRAVSLASVNQLLSEMDGTLADPAQHVEPLDALRQRLEALPYREQGEAFKRMYAAAQRIPKDGVQIQKALLLHSLRDFHWSHRDELFDFAYAMAQRRAPEEDNVWTELADSLRFLLFGSAEFIERYQALVARLASLRMSEQAELIPVLCRRMVHFAGSNDRLPGLYAVLREQALQLPPSHQGESVGMLASAIWVLPYAERLAQYTQLRDVALSLPDGQLGAALRYLLEGVTDLPSEHYAHELQLLEPALLRVLPAQRAQAALGLFMYTHRLDDALAKWVWQRGLSLLNGASEATLCDVLSRLRAQGAISNLDDHQWNMAVVEITRFMEANQFSEPARARFQDSVPWLRSLPH